MTTAIVYSFQKAASLNTGYINKYVHFYYQSFQTVLWIMVFCHDDFWGSSVISEILDTISFSLIEIHQWVATINFSYIIYRGKIW